MNILTTGRHYANKSKNPNEHVLVEVCCAPITLCGKPAHLFNTCKQTEAAFRKWPHTCPKCVAALNKATRAKRAG